MFPRRGADGVSDGYREGSYKRHRMHSEYPAPSPYGGYYGAEGSYPQWPHSGSRGGGAGNAFPVVRLRGFPFNCTERDVYDFFTGLDILDVLFVKKQHRFSGDAFVLFSVAFQVDLALRKDRQNMGRRYIEVFRSRKEEYYQAIAEEINGENQPSSRRDQSNSSSLKDNNDNSEHQEESNNDEEDDEHTGVLKLRGLPFSVTKQEIIDFFGDYNVSEENVHIVCRSDGRATGDAFVEFESAEESKAAMSKDKMMIGTRYVELFPSTQDDKARAASKSGH